MNRPPLPLRRSTRRIVRSLRTLGQALAAGLLTGLAYFGPFIVAVLSTRIPDLDVGLERPAPAVQYMASMSLTPFPDPTAEVIEVTQELLEPPPRMKPKEKTPPKSEDQPEQPSAPVEGVEGPGTPIASGAQSQKEPEEGGGQRVGGRVRGPTQDGEGSRRQECLPPNPDIVQTGEHRYRVKRDIVDYYVNHLREAEALAATWWVQDKEGENKGFKVSRIRCGNDLYQAGFRGGDVVLSINDEEITSTAQAIRAYMKVRASNTLRVKIKRQKQVIELVYRLV